jgi:hypothetical protein
VIHGTARNTGMLFYYPIRPVAAAAYHDGLLRRAGGLSILSGVIPVFYDFISCQIPVERMDQFIL